MVLYVEILDVYYSYMVFKLPSRKAYYETIIMGNYYVWFRVLTEKFILKEVQPEEYNKSWALHK